MRCVVWKERTTGLFCTPQDGMKVLAQGDVTVYERAGHYQLKVLQLQPEGVGDLQLAFERLKEILRQEGMELRLFVLLMKFYLNLIKLPELFKILGESQT